MKSLLKDQSARTITVNPAARRCGVDDQPARDAKTDKLDEIVEQMKGTSEFLAVSDRVLSFANTADQELAKLADARTKADVAGVEKAAQRIANLASEFGASNLIRSCYQLLITVRQGDQTGAFTLADRVAEDYAKLKTSLRLS